MEGQLAVHLPRTVTEDPSKLTDREILKMNKKKKKIFELDGKYGMGYIE